MLQRLAAKHESGCAEDALAHKDSGNESRNGTGIVDQHFRLHKHTHRNEEDGSEEVLHWCHKAGNLVGFHSLGQDAAHYEGPEGTAEAH